MANRPLPRNLILLALALVLAFVWDHFRPKGGGIQTPEQEEARARFTEKDLTYQGQTLVLTRHGRCRMDCRQLDPYEVQQVIDNGVVNPRKSKPAQGDRCKSVAYEGPTADGQRARIVVGECADRPILITAIDLRQKHQCTCD